MTLLPRLAFPQALDFRRAALDDSEATGVARRIIDELRTGDESTLRSLRQRYDGRPADTPLLLDADDLRDALVTLPFDRRVLLERIADRIRTFAAAQKACIQPLRLPVPGGSAGHTLEPIASVGCYAPGGRYPLPSSVLMTAIPARVAGCRSVTLACPSDDPVILAAAAIAGVDRLLHCGGAHAIAALAFGIATPNCDLIVGPGNRYVTAAKRLLTGEVGIDALAGPSELLILADDSADPALIAADLLAQAEHDADALPMLATTAPSLLDAVLIELHTQLTDLPTASVARQALANGFAVIVPDRQSLAELADAIAPEHLQLLTSDAAELAARIRNAGAVFIGPASAEVFGDYGLGPNHTLPTSGAARFSAGLSVMTFLRLRTFIEVEASPEAIISDTVALARLEGLEAHARAAGCRRGIG